MNLENFNVVLCATSCFRSETLGHVAKLGGRWSEVMKFWEPQNVSFFCGPTLGHELPKPHDLPRGARLLAVAAPSAESLPRSSDQASRSHR